jgi:hypothetical protein
MFILLVMKQVEIYLLFTIDMKLVLEVQLFKSVDRQRSLHKMTMFLRGKTIPFQ